MEVAMKKRIFLMFVCLCMLCGMLCASSGLNREPIYSSFEEKEATLIVNGQTLDVDGVYVYDGFEFRYPDASGLVPLKYPEAYAKLQKADAVVMRNKADNNGHDIKGTSKGIMCGIEMLQNNISLLVEPIYMKRRCNRLLFWNLIYQNS